MFVNVQQPKSMHEFSPNFQDLFTKDDIDLVLEYVEMAVAMAML